MQPITYSSNLALNSNNFTNISLIFTHISLNLFLDLVLGKESTPRVVTPSKRVGVSRTFGDSAQPYSKIQINNKLVLGKFFPIFYTCIQLPSNTNPEAALFNLVAKFVPGKQILRETCLSDVKYYSLRRQPD